MPPPRVLEGDARDLWPAFPDRVDAYREWLTRAEALRSRHDGHRARRDALATQATPANDDPRAASVEELEERRKNWQQPPYKATKGILKKYINCVATASEGCVTDE